ncbi:MAG: hypothetical protein JW901_08535 [Dehalococcoidia bacterium]|nr:hypothetical protein [Dehalococcoidia bacterium]
MIRKKWTKLTTQNLKKVPPAPGAYELASRNKKQIDTGGSNTSLHRRLPEKRKIRNTAAYFRYDVASFFRSGFDLEAEYSRRFQKKHGRKPKYTKRSPSIFNLFG